MPGSFDEFRDYSYEKVLNSKFKDRIPDHIFDTHLHNDFLQVPPYPSRDDDPANIRQLRMISLDYPNAKIILAHCALGHNPYRLKSGLIQIRDLPNVYFECSGVAEALSIYYVLKYFGPHRLMYGSDGYGYAIRLNRCFALGPSFSGKHFALMKPEEIGRHVFLYSAFEGLEALFAAGDIYGLDKEQWEDIFYNNAIRIYSLKK
jgi:glutamate-1-semialdehyde 2,1-aminomutase